MHPASPNKPILIKQLRRGINNYSKHETINFPGLAFKKIQPIRKMKTALLLIGITTAGIEPTFAQGYINFKWFGSGNPIAGVRIGSFSNPVSQLPGWYVSGDYSVEAWMAAGANQSEGSLVPIATTRTIFLGGATTTAAGSPSSDGSGLWFAGAQDTGLAVGIATIEVRAWYDPNHNLTWDQALQMLYNPGRSSRYNINLVSNTDPNIQSLDSI